MAFGLVAVVELQLEIGVWIDKFWHLVVLQVHYLYRNLSQVFSFEPIL